MGEGRSGLGHDAHGASVAAGAEPGWYFALARGHAWDAPLGSVRSPPPRNPAAPAWPRRLHGTECAPARPEPGPRRGLGTRTTRRSPRRTIAPPLPTRSVDKNHITPGRHSPDRP